MSHRMTHELLGQLTMRKETFINNPVSVEQMGELIDMVQSDRLTGGPIEIVFLCIVNLVDEQALPERRSCAIW